MPAGMGLHPHFPLAEDTGVHELRSTGRDER